MAVVLFNSFYDAIEEAIECYKSEYEAAAKKAALKHIELLVNFLEDDKEVIAFWERVKTNIKAL